METLISIGVTGKRLDERRELVLVDERMDVVKEFKHLGTVLSKHGKMEGEVIETEL